MRETEREREREREVFQVTIQCHEIHLPALITKSTHC